MDVERLKELITQGESLNVEFKGEEGGPLSDRDLIEAVVCMANRPTPQEAFVLIGVEDDGRVTGACPRHEAGTTDPRRLQALIANRTQPPLSCDVEVLDSEGKPVVVIKVPRATILWGPRMEFISAAPWEGRESLSAYPSTSTRCSPCLPAEASWTTPLW